MQWLSPGSATFCKFTTKLELEEELTQELGIFCRLSSALGLNFGLKFNKTFARFGALFASKLAFGNRFGFKTCKSLGEGNHLKVATSEGFPLL